MSDETQELISSVRQGLRGADEETVRVVSAISGLLITVAYADRLIQEEETEHLRAVLGRVHGLDAVGVEAILAVLDKHARRFSTAFSTRFSRVLREHGDRELCLEVLEMLVDLAASDGKVVLQEVTSLRNLTQALGLTQVDYNELQARHRDKLSFL